MIPLRDNLRCTVFPIVTLMLIALNCAAFFVELMVMGSGSPDRFFSTWTMIPSKVVYAFTSGDPTLIGTAVLTMFTSMFLHGGWMHLIGNMLYLYCFGRGMEARLGRFWFVVFYLASGLVAALAHIFSDPTSIVPTLGASGAIAGVLGGYLILWPKARVKGIFLIGIFPLLFTVSAFWYLLFWFAMQLTEVLGTVGAAAGGIAYWAHIGGFLAGLAFAGAVKLFRPESDVCYIPRDCECPPEGEGKREDGTGEDSEETR